MSRCWHQVGGRRKSFADDGGKRAVLRGEHEISRRAIAQGRPGCSACTCMLVCKFLPLRKRHAGPRVREAPGLSCALRFREGQRRCTTRAEDVARSQTHIQVSSPRTRGFSIPEAVVIGPRSRSVLDPRVRGDDTGVRGGYVGSCGRSRRKKPAPPQPKAAARFRINRLSPYADLKSKRPGHIPALFFRSVRYCGAADLFSTQRGHPLGLDWRSRRKIKSVGKTQRG